MNAVEDSEVTSEMCAVRQDEGANRLAAPALWQMQNKVSFFFLSLELFNESLAPSSLLSTYLNPLGTDIAPASVKL